MGTRADFYIGRGESAEWLGSVAWDGYPSGINPKIAPFLEGEHLFDSKTPEDFKARLAVYFAARSDVTLPDQGWPWPWDDSQTTDYAYAFDDGQVFGSCFGSEWFKAKEEPDEHADNKTAKFPNMAARKNVTFGKRSGIIIVGNV